MHGWFWYNWGNATSVLGLVVSLAGIGVSVWTLITAQSAKHAAIEAKNAASVRLLIDEVRRGEFLTRDLASFVAANSFAEATLRARDLQDLLGWVLEYWSNDLEIEWKTVLFDGRNEAEQISKTLRRLDLLQEEPEDREITKVNTRINVVFHAFLKVRAGLEKSRR